ncbi:hypothetical protein M3Y96_00431500 [Aphelenchoides besseyi]|nr:hypothetical protein M3Y96_00431500 [Aphelenchoides besseyi]
MPPFDCSLKQTRLSRAEMHRYFPELAAEHSEFDSLTWESILKAIIEAVDFKMLFIMGSLLILLFFIVLLISCKKPKRKTRLINQSKDQTPSREYHVTFPPAKLNDNSKSNKTSESNSRTSQTLSSDYITESIDDPYSLLSY